MINNYTLFLKLYFKKKYLYDLKRSLKCLCIDTAFNPFSAKATFLSFLTDIDKRVLYAKTQFAIDTVNIYFNKEVTKLYLKFMILKFK